MSDQFVHLHVHTEYSMLDGAAKVAPLFAEAERLGMPAIAMTDHGSMSAAAEFHRVAKKTGVKPIIGIEAYVAPGSRYDKTPTFWGNSGQRSSDQHGEGGDVSGAGAYTHMTMLAENATGLRNLFRLSSLASMQGFYRKPRMDRELIAEHAAGIIATTGCPSGEVQTRLRLGQPAEALQAASDYRDIFGAENYFLELMDHGLPIERSVRSGLLDIATKLGLPPLATNDSHYVEKSHAEAHSALLCVQAGKTLTDPTRFKFDGDGYYLKSAEEMREIWDREVPGATNSTLLIAERVQSYDEVFGFLDRMPRFPLPEGETESSWLRKEVFQYLPDRFPDGADAEHLERIEIELKVIETMGFPGYFLVVGDLVRWAKRQKISVGPGRGSATGSLVAFILQITDLDPIEHKLIFERFLNPERISPPDIDLDFDERRRGEVLRYVVDRWGSANVAQVITFGTIKAKAAIKDAARVQFGQPGFAIADRMTKTMPPAVMGKDISLSGIFDSKDPRYGEANAMRELVETDPDASKIMGTARGLEGLIRNAGVHACAVILSSEPLLDVLPLWQRDDGTVITSFDYPSCEDMGLLKMDILGLRTLTVLGDAIESVRSNHGLDIELDKLPLDDTKTYELLTKGDTLGVFQLDGGPMRNLLRQMAPDHFGDIAAVLALYRPGPMAANAHLDYADRKNGRKPVKPIHPELETALEPILGETYHLLVYQEQVMAIAQQLAGYTLGGADLLRRAMGKKKKEILDKEFENFSNGMIGNGYSPEATQTLWDVMLPFAGYAFNKSHTAGYGLVSYWTAYLKANFQTEYMAAVLTSMADDKDKSAVYLAECRKLGIKVLPPDVNESALTFTPTGTDIRFGLGAVRNVGAAVVNSIVRTRTGKPYGSFYDFLARAEIPVCNKRTIESLIKAGAFDSLGHTRKGLVMVHEQAVDSVIGLKREQARGQYDLFGAPDGEDGDGEQSSIGLDMPIAAEEWAQKMLLAHERDMLGLYVSSHPLAGAEHVLRRIADCSIADLDDDARADGSMVAIAGMISGLNRRVTKEGKPWATATVEDLDAGVEVLFFPKSYEVFGAELEEDAAVGVKGRLDRREGTARVIGMELITLDIAEATAGSSTPVVVSLPTSKVTAPLIAELKRTLQAHPGDRPVHIKLRGPSRDLMLTIANDYRVEVSSALMGELKGLLGVGCLT